ncbi:ComEA family DNA-binding protein [Prosthecobacter sp.]|uniref:ComEA family DNA-binding protein n=1 Tax=Prosthecobacter sp. TaxID=1965333 RepID=UPI0037848A9F
MKFFVCLLSVLVLSCGIGAAQGTTKSKAPPKPSAKVEAVAKTMTADQKAQLLNLLNQGDDAALMAIPGIGEVRAAAIKKARPYSGVTDVLGVSGIGEGTFAGMVEYARAGFKKPEKKAAAKPAP